MSKQELSIARRDGISNPSLVIERECSVLRFNRHPVIYHRKCPPPPFIYLHTYRLGLLTSLPKLIVNGGQVRLQMNILSPWTKRWAEHFFLVEYLLSTMLRLKICFPLIKINETTMITKINNSSKRTRLLPVYNGYLFFKFTTLIRMS